MTLITETSLYLREPDTIVVVGRIVITVEEGYSERSQLGIKVTVICSL